MTDPKQLRVLKKLAAHVEQTPGYVLAGRVFRGRSLLTIRDAEDAISILEFPRQDIYAPVGEHGIVRQESWAIMLQGWPADDPVNPGDPAYMMKAAVEMQLGRLVAQLPNGRGPKYPAEYLLGLDPDGQAELSSLTIAPGVVRPPEDAASRLAMFYMPLVLGIRVDVSNPY